MKKATRKAIEAAKEVVVPVAIVGDRFTEVYVSVTKAAAINLLDKMFDVDWMMAFSGGQLVLTPFVQE